MEDLCVYLLPQKQTVLGVDSRTGFHTCAVKKTLGYEDLACAHSYGIYDGEGGSISLDESVYLKCPLYTTDQNEAESKKGALVLETLLRKASPEVRTRFPFTFKNISAEVPNLKDMSTHEIGMYLLDLLERNQE